jgi:2,5-furandicarboxylate decarboxylase 1
VDPVHEISTLIKKLDGKPLYFDKVKDHSMPVISNICATRDLVCLGMGIARKDLILRMAEAIDHPKPPAVEEAIGYADIGTDLTRLPILTYYPFDGGPYIASGIAIAHDKEYGLNASYHRAMMFKGEGGQIVRDRLVLRILQRDFDAYIKRGLKEFAIPYRCFWAPPSPCR